MQTEMYFKLLSTSPSKYAIALASSRILNIMVAYSVSQYYLFIHLLLLPRIGLLLRSFRDAVLANDIMTCGLSSVHTKM